MDMYTALPDRIKVSCEADIRVLNTEREKGADKEDIDSVSNQRNTNMLIGAKTYINTLRMT
jgi:hypothetical protein